MESSEKKIVSDDEKYTAHVGPAIQVFKHKDQQESVAVHSGYVDSLPVIIKVFVLFNKKSSDRAGREIAALKKLKEKMCKHVPEYLFDKQVKLDGITPIIEHYVVMTKLPGDLIPNVLAAWRAWPTVLREQRVKIKSAFKSAITEVHQCLVDNGSHHHGNILYHGFTNTCYIIDFERADCSFDEFEDIPEEFRDIEEWVNW